MANTGALRVGNKFVVGRKIGAGSFGKIFQGTNITNGKAVAIKMESVRIPHSQLIMEFRLYRMLAGGIGIPRVYYYGTEGDYNVMAMDLLGPSLEDVFNKCKRQLSLKTVLMIADQILSQIKFIHSRGVLHRDIKPANFLIGLGEEETKIFTIDFGLVKRYIHPKTKLHIPYREGKLGSITGTARYASVNNLLGREQSRRDDLESISYILIYFLNGGMLPWQGLPASTKKDKYRRIAEVKSRTPVDQLCKNMPKEFAQFVNYCRELKFEETPDYDNLIAMFRNLAKQEDITYDDEFDWIVSRREQAEKVSGAVASSSQKPKEADADPDYVNPAEVEHFLSQRPTKLHPWAYSSAKRAWLPVEDSKEAQLSPLVTASTLKIVSYNVWFVPELFQERNTEILNILGGLNADIICLQEVIPNFLTIVKQTPWICNGWYLSDATGDTLSPYGVLILSRYPFSCRLHPLPSGMKRRALIASFNVNGEPLEVCTVHLESLDSRHLRALQLDIIHRVLGAVEHSVLLGDFNFDSSSNFLASDTRPLEELRLKSTYTDYIDVWPTLHPTKKGWTYDSTVNKMLMPEQKMRYDRVLLRSRASRWAPASAHLIGTDALKITHSSLGPMWPSDHFGLCASLQWKP